ncbi:ROK family transcriptional regulator [Consotaella aegiceratis]|uniref:ROK family transcriptional regulator n=1 Tax=Consotaella aegiceratis TaxID=3097961 RepID=UPI002F3F3635
MKTADPELMRAINRFHVLDTVRRAGAISRVEIGERTELSATTVSAITASLLDDGLISVRHEGDLRNGNGRGRPRVMLSINPDAARVVGAKIGSCQMDFVVTNFRGDVLSSLALPVRVDRLPVDVIVDLVEDGVRRCVMDAGLALTELTAVAIALPGVIEHGTGLVRSSSIFKEANVALSTALESRLEIATVVESDANAAAMAQHWFRHGRTLDDFVLVAAEEALGLAVLHGGQIFRGAQELSLTLGDMIMGADSDRAAKLHELAGDRAVLPSSHSDPRIREAIRLGQGMSLAAELIRAGDENLREAATRAGAALGVAMANLVGLFAPPRVILVGAMLKLGDHLLEPLRRSFAAGLPKSLQNVAEIVVDEAEDAVWARGAAAVALSELYGAPWGTTGPARRTARPSVWMEEH